MVVLGLPLRVILAMLWILHRQKRQKVEVLDYQAALARKLSAIENFYLMLGSDNLDFSDPLNGWLLNRISDYENQLRGEYALMQAIGVTNIGFIKKD